MTVGSLFSGIGGLDLGFERAGFEIKWMCEKEDYPRKVLAKHWPNVPIYEDVREITNAPSVDVLVGGFPCQDNSTAFTKQGRIGIAGAKSGLWLEFARIIREVRPAYVVVENVEGLLHRARGFGIVLGDLARLGYDAEWDVLPASASGAPHQRARLWLVAYPNGDGEPDGTLHDEAQVLPRTGPTLRDWPDPP